MLDRTIPFYNIILKCTDFTKREVCLPDGFDIISYQDGYEEDWARLEFEIGDFDSLYEARDYFVSNYLQNPELFRKILFLRDAHNEIIGSCIAWQDKRGLENVASLHWLIVDEKYRGKGFGRALCNSVMNEFLEKGETPVYIHTQPWSWKAIMLYLSLGFRIQKTDTFSHYENQYDRGMETLKAVVDQKQFEMMRKLSE